MPSADRAVMLVLSSGRSDESVPSPTPTDPSRQKVMVRSRDDVVLRRPGTSPSDRWVFVPLAEGSSLYRIKNVAMPGNRLLCLTMGDEYALGVAACRANDEDQWWRVSPVRGALRIDLIIVMSGRELITAYSRPGFQDHSFFTPVDAGPAPS